MFKVGDEKVDSNIAVKADTIYHYTSASVLPVFFEPGADLYCTNAKCLNDTKEMIEGAYGFAKYLTAKKIFTENRAKLLRQHIDETLANNWFDLWVMSLTVASDCLSHWRGYTAQTDGGYSIGFNTKKLLDALTAVTDDKKINGIPMLGMCLYAKEDRAKIEDFYAHVYEHQKSAFDNYASKQGGLLPEDIRPVIASTMLTSMYIKHDAFKEEKEARIAMIPPDTDYSSMRIIGSKPRMPIGLSTLEKPLHYYIDKIYVSPHGNRSSLRAQAEWLKRKHNAMFEISDSEIPYDPSR